MEILVVVMVILVIAAIAIPNMVHARMQANEASAVSSMHAIHTAEALYSDTYPQVGFAGNLADLGSRGTDCKNPGKSNACIIMDSALSGGVKSGYTFQVVGDGNVPDATYTVTATPQSPGSSGRCSYTSDQGGQIRTVPNGTASRFSSGGGGSSCGP